MPGPAAHRAGGHPVAADLIAQAASIHLVPGLQASTVSSGSLPAAARASCHSASMLPCTQATLPANSSSHAPQPTWSTVASFACAACRSALSRASRLRTASCAPPPLPCMRARSALRASGVTASAAAAARELAGVPAGVARLCGVPIGVPTLCGVPAGVAGSRLAVRRHAAGVPAGVEAPLQPVPAPAATVAAAMPTARLCSCCACWGSIPSAGVGGGTATKFRGVNLDGVPAREPSAAAAGRLLGVAASPAGSRAARLQGVAAEVGCAAASAGDAS